MMRRTGVSMQLALLAAALTLSSCTERTADTNDGGGHGADAATQDGSDPAPDKKINPKVPDLTATSLSATSPAKGTISYSVRVCNKGTGPAGAFKVHFFRNRAAPPKTTDLGDRLAQTGGLGAGACRYIGAKDSGLPGGKYSTWVRVDPEGAVAESDDTNNTAGPVPVLLAGTKKPDLVVTLLSGSANTAGTVTYKVTVCNKGTATASAFQAGLYYHLPSAPKVGHVSDAAISVKTLAAGACTSASRSVKLPDWSYSSWAFVDVANKVAESDEANNAFGPIKVKVGGGIQPDLLVTGIATKADSSGKVTYSVKVCNHGGAGTSKGFAVQVYYNRSSAPKPGTAPNLNLGGLGLAAKQCKTVALKGSLKPGTYYSWAQVDRLNAITESNESNNTYGPVAVTVSAGNLPDLKVTSMTAKAYSSGLVTYTVKVCNGGSAGTSKSFALQVYYNRSSPPVPGSGPNLNLGGLSLTAGQCKTVTLKGSLKSGTSYSWAQVDRLNAIKESNEANNTYGAVTVTVGSVNNRPDLVITAYKGNPTGYNYTHLVTTICNKGKAASGQTTLELYLNRSSKPTSSVAGDHSVTIAPLKVGACYTNSFPTVLSPGSYVSWAYIDRANRVAESAESNNVRGPVTIKVPGSGKADLKVTGLSASVTNNSVYYKVTVCNNGSTYAGFADVDLYYHRGSAPPASLQGNVAADLGQLIKGACATRSLYATLPAGTYKAWARVDRKNIVPESIESNNVRGPVTVKVSGSTGKADLQITKVSTTHTSGGTTNYLVTVCNKGTGTAGTCKLEVYLNRTGAPPVSLSGDSNSSVPTLLPNGCSNQTISVKLGSGGYASWLWIDRIDAVPESDQTNNLVGPQGVVVP